MRNAMLLILALVAVLMLPGCGVTDQRAQNPLPAAEKPTPSQAALEQQLADEHDRRLKLEALLGAPAKTLAEQAAARD